ncbi:hypothetical protein [Georgenia sp. H159]|uniref:hypothetical protein n=1 Tax=Georgenia sp. H159 TaxID=3076115 RepID=UPI002D774988|nr:hypothetical protein [Georgenia sp. H159]
MAPPTRLGASEEGNLTPTTAPAARADGAADASSARPTDHKQQPPAVAPLPVRAGEDTDEGWGELPERSDDARYLRDKPPHWQ